MRQVTTRLLIMMLILLILLIYLFNIRTVDTYTSCIPVQNPYKYTFLLGLNGIAGKQLGQLDFSNSSQQGPTYPSQWSVDVNTVYSAIPVSVRYARYCPKLNSSCTPEEVCLSALPLAVDEYYSVLILFNSEDMGYNTQTNNEIYSETWPQAQNQFDGSLSTIAQNAPVFSKGYLLYKGTSEFSFLFYQWGDNIINVIPTPVPLVQGLLFDGGSVPVNVLPYPSNNTTPSPADPSRLPVTVQSLANINYATPNPEDVGPPAVGSR